MKVYLNGEVLPRSEARVGVEDRGFLFGDGVYEVIRAFRGRLFEADGHVRRMEEGCRALGIRLREGLDCAHLREVGERLLAENGRLEGDATVYLQVTRGAAPRTHHYPGPETAPTLYVATADFSHPPEIHRSGASAILHPDLRWTRCSLKTVNLLPNVMAKQKAREAGAFEAIFVRDGLVTEGASTNVFAVVDGRLRTYPVSPYILAGITREVVIGLAREREMPVREEPVSLEELGEASEVFLTGTTTDVLPVIRIDGGAVGEGRPGPYARTLQSALWARIREQTPATA